MLRLCQNGACLATLCICNSAVPGAGVRSLPATRLAAPVFFPESCSPLITPILRKSHTNAETPEDGAEARMRQALGRLGTAKAGKSEAPRRATHQATPGAHRHRFRQDGEVPVVRLTLAEGGRSGERQPRAPVEEVGIGHGQASEASVQGNGESARQVQMLTEQLRATQTRLGHAELALDEAGKVAQARQEEVADLHQALDAAEATLAQVRVELAASERAHDELNRHRPTPRHPGPEADAPTAVAIRRKVGRPFGSTNRARDQIPASEPKPVKWWTGD